MIKINKKEYELVYDINVMCKMASNGIDVMNNGFDKILNSLPNLRKAFSYGLMHNNKKMNEHIAGKLMSQYLNEGHTIQDIIEEVSNAIAEALGINEEEAEDKEENEDEIQGK